MSNTINCPYCECENDKTDACDFDTSWICEECDKNFALEVSYEPIFETSKDCKLNNQEHEFIEKTRQILSDEAIYIRYDCINCDIQKNEITEPKSKEKQ